MESTWNDRSSRNEVEFWRGDGFWNTWTNSGTTLRRGNADSNGPRTRDASSQQQRRKRCGGQEEDGDLWPILCGSCENESDWQSRPLYKHSRRAYSKAAERGRQIDRYWPDHHYTEVTGTQERRVTSEDRYITMVSPVLVTAVTYLGFEHRMCTMATAEDSQWNLLPRTLTNAWTLFNCSTQKQWWRLWRNRRVWIYMMRRQRVIKFNTHCSEQLSENCSTYITRVRPDLMFATKCLSYKLASPTLADLTRVKKVLRCLKGTRELNLFLTIPALKPKELNKTLKHITGYSDADWASDPVTRKSTSCTLCYVDQFLWTSECRGQGTVALSSGESEMYALGALSAELIFAQAKLKEIGLSFQIHARADSSTARAVATKRGASRKMKHIHTRFLFIQDLVFRKLLTMSSVMTDVNPSDIGTEALRCERFHRLRSMLSMGTELSETSSPGKWYSGDEWLWKSLDTSMVDWTSRTIDTCEQA